MYREKTFRVRDLAETLADVEAAGRRYGRSVEKVVVADGDALVLPLAHWRAILAACGAAFPSLRRVSRYAMARNVIGKTDEELATLRAEGLSLLYVGPGSGDDVTLKRIAKGQDHAEHVEAARRAKRAGMALSVIFLLGAGGVERSDEHALASAGLATAMDPEYLSALTLTVVPGTPLATLVGRGRFELPAVPALLRELRTFVAERGPRTRCFGRTTRRTICRWAVGCRTTGRASSRSSTRRSTGESGSGRRSREGCRSAGSPRIHGPDAAALQRTLRLVPPPHAGRGLRQRALRRMHWRTR
ncbi:MAG: Oxygen-independent coproporphyrinogen oxidase, Fe-S oxidoreductase [Myxococcaceae bacterium]|nr:Oxygen-independent coproporphyrinogen oxidase, Fe-S oxidoreductase [Myxococcaceae bacterium]